jgi:hypothetical protein
MIRETEKATEAAGIESSLPERRPRSAFGALMAHRLKRGALLYWAALFTMSAAVLHVIAGLKEPPPSGVLVASLLGLAVFQIIAAIAVVAVPARRLLCAAAIIEAAALLLWIIAHTIGLSDGRTTWRPETLGVPDLYLPVMEGISACFFFCLFGRTWAITGRVGRTMLA